MTPSGDQGVLPGGQHSTASRRTQELEEGKPHYVEVRSSLGAVVNGASRERALCSQLD